MRTWNLEQSPTEVAVEAERARLEFNNDLLAALDDGSLTEGDFKALRDLVYEGCSIEAVR